MNRSLKAVAISRAFAAGKDRVIYRKADTSALAALYASAAQAFYVLCGSLRGSRAVTTGTHAHPSTHQNPWCKWMSGMQPCLSTVRRLSPDVVRA